LACETGIAPSLLLAETDRMLFTMGMYSALESNRSKQEVIVAIGLKTEVRGLRETLIELRELDTKSLQTNKF
jgi:hypothetical protein